MDEIPTGRVVCGSTIKFRQRKTHVTQAWHLVKYLVNYVGVLGGSELPPVSLIPALLLKHSLRHVFHRRL
jgi:hypothetical protein